MHSYKGTNLWCYNVFLLHSSPFFFFSSSLKSNCVHLLLVYSFTIYSPLILPCIAPLSRTAKLVSRYTHLPSQSLKSVQKFHCLLILTNPMPVEWIKWLLVYWPWMGSVVSKGSLDSSAFASTFQPIFILSNLSFKNAITVITSYRLFLANVMKVSWRKQACLWKFITEMILISKCQRACKYQCHECSWPV